MRTSWLARAVSRCTSFLHSGRVSSSRKSCAARGGPQRRQRQQRCGRPARARALSCASARESLCQTCMRQPTLLNTAPASVKAAALQSRPGAALLRRMGAAGGPGPGRGAGRCRARGPPRARTWRQVITRASKPSMLSRLSRSYTHTSSMSCAHTCAPAPARLGPRAPAGGTPSSMRECRDQAHAPAPRVRPAACPTATQGMHARKRVSGSGRLRDGGAAPQTGTPRPDGGRSRQTCLLHARPPPGDRIRSTRNPPHTPP